MGNKYIIEIEKAYTPVRRRGAEPKVPPRLYLAKGFNSLVFDEEGLNKLEKYDPDKWYDRGYEQGCADTEKENMLPTDAEAYGYEKGLEDAWEAARKIAMYPDNGGLQATDLLNVFKLTTPWSIFKNYSADEAIKKIKAYEEKQRGEAEIRVGDEVIVNGLRAVVIKLDEKGNVDRFFTSDGKTYGNISGFQNNEVKKAGRHFPEVAELLEKMKEGEEE